MKRKIADELDEYVGRSPKQIADMFYKKLWAEYQQDDGVAIKDFLLLNSDLDREAGLKYLKTMLRDNAENETKYVGIMLKQRAKLEKKPWLIIPWRKE